MKVIPPYLTFRDALRRGFVGRIENRSYMEWVKGLPCVSCSQPADDPHHLYGSGYKGMGTKVPDYLTIPVCRNCHDALHHNVSGWEEVNGSQWEHAAMTMLQAIYQGVLNERTKSR